MKPQPIIGLTELINNIDKAKEDPKIEGIYLELTNLAAGVATVDEIRNALLDFKESGKFVICYSNLYTQSTYYLGSVADEVYLNPEGMIYMKGLNMQIEFFKGTFEKLGIEPEVFRHGEFKSAVEPLIDKKMSDANRIQIKSFMGSIWQYVVANIAKQRHVSTERINLLADRLELWNPKTGISEKLIDSLVYRDQVYDVLKEKTGLSEKKKPNLVDLSDYSKVPKEKAQKGLVKEKIAVIYAQGDIVSGDGDQNEIGADRFVNAISDARKDSDVKAIVLRVNSPGGYSLAAELIWREIELARQVKPVIASMGDLAASGGYYILCPADTIVASPVTLTGSIGVFGVWWDAGEFFNKKLGITSDVEKTNTYSDFGSVFRPFTSYEKLIVQKSVDRTYRTFVNHVSEGRRMTYNSVDKIGEGRVWSGINGIEIGLVDVFGGLKDAIRIAAEKANLEVYRIVELPKQEEPFELLIRELTGEMRINSIREELGNDFKYYELLKKAEKIQGIQARLPFSFELR